MIKISKESFNNFKENSIDTFTIPGGNFWIFHYKHNNKFYPIKHKAGQYWIGKPTKYFSEVLRAIWSIENNTWQNPANQKIFGD